MITFGRSHTQFKLCVGPSKSYHNGSYTNKTLNFSAASPQLVVVKRAGILKNLFRLPKQLVVLATETLWSFKEMAGTGFEPMTSRL